MTQQHYNYYDLELRRSERILAEYKVRFRIGRRIGYSNQLLRLYIGHMRFSREQISYYKAKMVRP